MIEKQNADMPTRTVSQIIGDRGERLVEALFSDHRLWVARRQMQDFGVDLEAELAAPSNNGQLVQGKLIKIQVKTCQRVERKAGYISFQIERRLLEYADGFKIPVVFMVVCLETRTVWWLWLQEWLMLNEARLARQPEAATTALHIPADQTLDRGLAVELPAIASGSNVNAMILALRSIVTASAGWQDREIADGVIDILSKVHGDSRSWTLQKVIDKLLGLGPDPRWWEAQQMLPALLKLVETSGDSFSPEQILRLVGRGESYSRTGLLALAHLYDWWREPTTKLGLSEMFQNAGLGQVAWYAAMRERFPTGKGQVFALYITELRDADLKYGDYRLELTEDTQSYIVCKWPNRSDSILLDCLSYEGKGAEL